MFINKKYEKLLRNPFDTSLDMLILYMEFVCEHVKDDFISKNHPTATLEALKKLKKLEKIITPGEKTVLNMSKDEFKQKIYMWTSKIQELEKKEDFVDSKDFDGLFKLIFE